MIIDNYFFDKTKWANELIEISLEPLILKWKAKAKFGAKTDNDFIEQSEQQSNWY